MLQVALADIYYRETIDSNTLSIISMDIRNAFNLNFRATWAFIITYDRVIRFNAVIENSFQLLITTDGYTSYAIYNYGQLSWYDDSCALYNAGDGIRYSILPGSQTSDILKLSNASNIGVPGKWIFDVRNHS